jgi:hypothetical protein
MKAKQLKQSIDDFTAAYNERATPFVWRKREAKGVQLRYTIVDLCSAPRWRVSPVEEGSIQGIVDCSGS